MDNMEIQRIINRIAYLERRINNLESQVDNNEKISAVELMKIKDELNSLKLEYYRRFNVSNLRNVNGYIRKEEQKLHKLDILEKPVKHIDNEIKSKINNINTLSDIKFSKVILPLIAAILIILSAMTFVGAFWGIIPNAIKAILLIGLGGTSQFIGVKIYDYKKLYPLIVLSAIGSAVSYIGIIAANIIYGILNIYITTIMLFGWAILNLFCYIKYSKRAMLLVTSLGIIASTILVGLKLQDATTSIEVLLYTVVVLMLTLLPVILGNIKQIKCKIKHTEYNPITIGVAITSIVSYGAFFSNYSYGNSSLIIKLIALIIISVLIVLNYKEDATNKIKIGIYMTEIQAVLLASLNILENNFSDIFSVIIYTLLCLIILSKEAKGQKTYRYVSFNLAVALYGLSSILVGGCSEIPVFIFTILLFIAVITLIEQYINKLGDRILEKYLSMIPLIAILFSIGAYEMPLKGSLLALTLDSMLVLAIITLFQENRISNKKVSASEQILQIIIDIIVIVLALNRVSLAWAINIFIAYSLIVRFMRYTKMKNLYRVVYLLEILVTSISIFIIAIDSGNLVTILSSILMIGLMMTFILKEEQQNKYFKTTISIGGTILTIMMVIAIASVIEGKMLGYVSIVSMVLSASALILLGIVKIDKPMRITATIMLLLSTWILVNSLSVLNNTMGNVLALLISGLIVLGISIICSKVEKTAALKEKLKKE